jgi:hypothetical protein
MSDMREAFETWLKTSTPKMSDFAMRMWTKGAYYSWEHQQQTIDAQAERIKELENIIRCTKVRECVDWGASYDDAIKFADSYIANLALTPKVVA